MSDLARDARLLAETVNDLDEDVTKIDVETLTDDLRDQGLICWALLEDANRQLAVARADLAKKLASLIPDKRITLMNVGTFEKHRKADRKKWDREELVRVVLDSRMVDTATGEFLDETPLDKVRDVWNLGAPRTTALKARGIDPDEFCEVEYGSLTLQLVADNTPKEEAA